ncbi:MAG: low specificity L-threonine aldolase [Anaerosomatales bacterium]|nr:low specificity L-threonine aldolase [Anaerosomatales bacterium]
MTGRTFASDNNSGVHPAVLEAIARANEGHVHAYGDDPYTQDAIAVLRRHFGDDAAIWFVFNGTGANVTALSSVMRPFNAVICADTAHINTDECGAPERFTGSKLIDLPSGDAKLTPEQVRGAVRGVGVEHHVQPRVLSLTQSTEYGTVYTPEELRALADTAHAEGLLVHVDGARISNAAAALGCTLAEITRDVGVDVLSLGGTKNGLLLGEAVVFFDPALAPDFAFVRKQSAQLASKMRFVSAQFSALFEDGLWLHNASHANAMAALLAREAAGLPGVVITQKVEANEVFARVPAEKIAALQAIADFYVWDERTAEVRWVTSWDTTQEDVRGFVAGMREVLGG